MNRRSFGRSCSPRRSEAVRRPSPPARRCRRPAGRSAGGRRGLFRGARLECCRRRHTDRRPDRAERPGGADPGAATRPDRPRVHRCQCAARSRHRFGVQFRRGPAIPGPRGAELLAAQRPAGGDPARWLPDRRDPGRAGRRDGQRHDVRAPGHRPRVPDRGRRPVQPGTDPGAGRRRMADQRSTTGVAPHQLRVRRRVPPAGAVLPGPDRHRGGAGRSACRRRPDPGKPGQPVDRDAVPRTEQPAGPTPSARSSPPDRRCARTPRSMRKGCCRWT